MSEAALAPLSEVVARLWPKKSLGQHFLLDESLLARIVRGAGDLSTMQVIEVGPGPGGLTRAILHASPKQLTALEKDRRCIQALQPLAQHYGSILDLREADALRVPLASIGSAPRCVIANLPYNVGTQLVVNWLMEAATQGVSVLSSLTVMLQKEVAERMIAQPGDPAYGRLSVLMHQLTQATILFEVPASAFTPPPKVASAVLHARLLPEPREAVPLPLLEKVVATAFNQRRKMLRQSLKALGVDAHVLCAHANVEETVRPEACDLAAFARLALAFAQMRDEIGNI